MEREDHEGHADPEAAALESGSHHSEPQQQQQSAADNDSTPSKKAKGEKIAAQTLPLQAPHSNNNNSSSLAKSNPSPPRLIHSSFLRIPMQIRYVIYGTISSALFMVLYNTAVDQLGHYYFPSTIYAVTYMVFIPIQHALASGMVFGWPQRYIPSLTANIPIGLTAIALGSYLTAYLDQISFNDSAEQVVRRLQSGLIHNGTATESPQPNNNSNNNNSNGEFYTSLVVLIVTSFWSFLLAVIVNAPPETSEKKQL